MSVIRLGYVHIRVTDLARARAHYADTLGMDVVAEEANRVYLKSWDEDDHHSVVLEEGGVGLVKFGYKVTGADSLADLENRVAAFGATSVRMSKGDNVGIGDGLRVTLPSEHTLELYADVEYLGTKVGKLNPDPWPRDGIRGIGVPRINHALITAEDPAQLERFFELALGFRPAERLVGGDEPDDLVGSWMFCGENPHDIAFVKGPNGKLHHFAHQIDDWSALLRAGDVMSMDDVPIDFGPTRHGITRGGTIYFFDPSGNRNEVFSGGYRTGPDFRPITWTMDQAARGVNYTHREIDQEFLSVVT
ncbi:3,4-dihydroxyphenylacetate 2,3-dioxygenase [Virgisporangium aliadipatigenens]|uniref:Metapyrocatechase n=1 Tax=Virgisporangium aliadipatigenens TaxID=741659 RepID=A0A8J4DXD0_9ACTN|nr:catechol 2,3-dioxygenase [Virgisporangium aliadipatigenens]GIJ51972.1 3,4-dihydroxyphenylacetate 2,3-dioxygenase [Virgisporangium aliadipatigenens]